jgi:hypothetical protein
MRCTRFASPHSLACLEYCFFLLLWCLIFPSCLFCFVDVSVAPTFLSQNTLAAMAVFPACLVICHQSCW